MIERAIEIKRKVDLKYIGNEETIVIKKLWDKGEASNYMFSGLEELYFHRAYVLAKMGKEHEANEAMELVLEIRKRVLPHDHLWIKMC